MGVYVTRVYFLVFLFVGMFVLALLPSGMLISLAMYVVALTAGWDLAGGLPVMLSLVVASVIALLVVWQHGYVARAKYRQVKLTAPVVAVVATREGLQMSRWMGFLVVLASMIWSFLLYLMGVAMADRTLREVEK